MPDTGGWRGLLEILQAASSEAGQPHREHNECPNDGTTYKVGPNGERYCPFDGHRPGGHTS